MTKQIVGLLCLQSGPVLLQTSCANQGSTKKAWKYTTASSAAVHKSKLRLICQRNYSLMEGVGVASDAGPVFPACKTRCHLSAPEKTFWLNQHVNHI